METETKQGTEPRRLTLDLIEYVEARQRPRETFPEAARRVFMSGDPSDIVCGHCGSDWHMTDECKHPREARAGEAKP